MVYLVIVVLILLGLCYLLGNIFFRGEQDETKRFVKGLIAGGVLFVVAAAGFIYRYIKKEKKEDAIKECEGVHATRHSDFVGKWETETSFLTFSDSTVVIEYHKGGEERGSWKNEGSMLILKLANEQDEKKSLRVCLYTASRFYFRDISTGYNYVATRL